MNYLSRLALQSGLVAQDGPQSLTPTLEVLYEVVETGPTPVAPTVAPDPETSLLSSEPAFPANVVVEETEEVFVKAPVSQASPEPEEDATDLLEVEAVPVPELPDPADPVPEFSAPSDLDRLTPAPDPREFRIQQVLEWVAQNDLPDPKDLIQPPQESATPNLPIPADTPKNARQPAPQAEPPALEIVAEIAAPATPSAAVPATPLPEPQDATDKQSIDHQNTSEPAVVEERIDISIGTIRLDVTPPPAGAAAARHAAPAPPQPPAPRATTEPYASSRLRRRFIRM